MNSKGYLCRIRLWTKCRKNWAFCFPLTCNDKCKSSLLIVQAVTSVG